MIALDLFAGTGWGVACQRLGIEEMGVEIMPEAVATREANGMKTIYRDVWEGLEGHEIIPDHDLQIASPPCPTFSNAGNGAGRRAMPWILEAIQTLAFTEPARLREFGETHDPLTALVLTPLAYAYQTLPTYLAWEQVPAVLPVWEACADVLRDMGYSVVTGNLQAEQYGVPQTRKRAVLIARRDGFPAHLPVPTHSRYYRNEPGRMDAGVLPWVSMADALGWGRTTAPAPTYCNSGHGGAGIEWGGNSIRKAMREQSLMGDRWKPKPDAEPGTNDAIRVTVQDAAAVQSYPVRRGLTNRPAPTITGGGIAAGGAEPVAKWHQRYTAAPDWVGSTDRLTPAECGTLQSYPDFTWCGTKTKQYLQIGNAVPPLLAQAILETFL